MNSRSKSLLVAVVAVGAALCSAAEVKTLVWNGSAEAGNVWNRTALNWLDGETPTAWIEGSDVRFVRDGDSVVVSEHFEVRQISVAQNVSVKPVLTGAASGVDTSAAPYEGERGLAWGSLFNSTSNWTVIWRNRRLSTIEDIVGGRVRYSTSGDTGRGYFYLYDAATDTATVQIQPDSYSSTQIIATDLKFRQNGDDIEAIVLGSGYANRSPDSPEYHDRVPLRSGSLYQVGNLLASTKGGKLLVTAGGGFSRISGMRIGVRIDDGTMDTKDEAAEGTRQLDWDTWIPDNQWVTIWKNRRLSNITGIGYAYFSAGSKDGKGYGWAYYPETDTAWVQIQPDYASETQMWGCNLAFRQRGEDIEVVMTNAYCYAGRTPGTAAYHNILPGNTSGTYRKARRLLAISGVGNLPISYSGTNLNASVVMKSSSASPTKIWEDVRLADLVAVYGKQTSTSGEIDNAPVAFVNNGTTATVQLQRLCQRQTETTDGLITYLNLEFTQVDADVYVRVNYAGYRWFFKDKITTDPQIFPDTRLPTNVTTGSSDYSTKPSMLTGYFKPATIAAPIDDISFSPTLKDGGLTFSGADMGDDSFNFAWPLNVSSEYMPIAFTNDVKAVFPEGLTNSVAVAQFSGATTLTLPTDAAFEVGNAEIGEGASFVIDADIDAKPVRIGTTRCLSIAELAAFSTSQGDLLSQDSAGYLVPRKGIFILVK